MDWTVRLRLSSPDVGVVIVGDVLHREHLAVLLRLLVLWPEGGVGLRRNIITINVGRCVCVC